MKNSYRHFIVFILLFVGFIWMSCGTTRYSLPVFNKSSDYPEGVDSLIVAKSDSIIRNLFVDFSSQQKASRLEKQARSALIRADSLWQMYQATCRDSSDANAIADADSDSQSTDASDQMIKSIKNELQHAERNFLQSVRLNPFPLHSKEGLAQTYLLWANIDQADSYYQKALSIFQDMTAVEKGEHILFYRLGECYFHLKHWEQALASYQQAEKILLSTPFQVDSTDFKEVPDDSVKREFHFNYLYSQAICLARMYRAVEALTVIKKARQTAPSPERLKIAERLEDWLNWDNGNIQAAEEKNQILELIKRGKYAAAVDRFEKLKRQLSDPFAIDEIEWRIAGLEFKYLGKKPHACRRMLNIIKKNETSPYYPPHLMNTYNKYVTDCGIMHYHLGMEYIQHADYKQAQKYLEQGAKLNWYGNYKCQLELAKLNKHDPQISLKIIEKVLSGKTDLTDSEKLVALEIKLSALRKLGPQYLQKTREIYHQIRKLQQK